MAAESLLGGSSGQELSSDTIALLDQFLTDTVGGSAQTSHIGTDATMIVGTGSQGEIQGAVISGSVAVAAEVNDGVMSLAISMPAGVNIAFEGLSSVSSSEDIQGYLNDQINAALPEDSSDPAVQALRSNLQNALEQLLNGLGEEGAVVRLVRIVDNSGSSSASLATQATAQSGHTITFDASGNHTSEVLALLLSDIKAQDTLELKGVERGLLVGSGTVVVNDTAAANLHGDLNSQKITGGSGNDTLVGGGGNDTLVGGAGDDTIGFDAVGHYTVQYATGDTLAFDFSGINSIADLLPHVTNVSESNGSVTYEFDHGAATITLVGISASEITAEMIKFTI